MQEPDDRIARGSVMDCVPLDALPALVDGLLLRAGASKTLRANVVAAVGELDGVGGQVESVITQAGKRWISVLWPTKAVTFEFPPNGKDFEAELLRAQDAGRVVAVLYRKVAGAPNMVESVFVYAGLHPRY